MGINAVGIIIFDGEKFLLLHRMQNWCGWEYAKGGIEKDETLEDAISRELFEETGIEKFELITEIDKLKYFNKKQNSDCVIKNFLVRVSSTAKVHFNNQEKDKNGNIILEHDSYKWFLPNEAIQKLTHNNMKNSLKKAIDFLSIDLGMK